MADTIPCLPIHIDRVIDKPGLPGHGILADCSPYTKRFPAPLLHMIDIAHELIKGLVDAPHFECGEKKWLTRQESQVSAIIRYRDAEDIDIRNVTISAGPGEMHPPERKASGGVLLITEPAFLPD